MQPGRALFRLGHRRIDPAQGRERLGGAVRTGRQALNLVLQPRQRGARFADSGMQPLHLLLQRVNRAVQGFDLPVLRLQLARLQQHLVAQFARLRQIPPHPVQLLPLGQQPGDALIELRHRRGRAADPQFQTGGLPANPAEVLLESGNRRALRRYLTQLLLRGPGPARQLGDGRVVGPQPLPEALHFADPVGQSAGDGAHPLQQLRSGLEVDLQLDRQVPDLRRLLIDRLRDALGHAVGVALHLVQRAAPCIEVAVGEQYGHHHQQGDEVAD